jgi:uncharacterized protein (UPF0276 family)
MADDFLRIKNQLPTLGIGLGLRRDMAEDTFEQSHCVDWVEIAPENFMGIGGRARDLLERARERFPVISHGLNLSVGSTDDLSLDYLKELKLLLDSVNAPWWSDHLCFTSVGGVYMHDLLPLPFTREAVSHVAKRAKIVQNYIERPFLLENISFYMYPPGGELTESQFLAEVAEEADCGLLLDVNNIYVNSINHKFDPYKFVDEIPVERTVQIHLAGHKKIKDTIIDTHGAPVVEPVHELLECVLKRTSVMGVMLERDQNFPDFQEIVGELNVLRQIASRTQPLLAQPSGSKEEAHARSLSA